VLAPAIASGGVIYVDADAPPGGNGQMWATAYKYLQDALVVVQDGNDIWVADGTYKPDANSADPNGTGDRTSTFQLINGVGLYGGFASGESSLDERDSQTNETILSGDLDGNDVQGLDPCDLLSHPNRAENSYHVVTAPAACVDAVLDGFTITGGNANGSDDYNRDGGGMYSFHSSTATVVNCTFIANSAKRAGGALFMTTGSPTVMQCTITSNSTSGSGAGIYCSGGELVISDCNISYCCAGYYGSGGGIHCRENHAVITNTSVSGCSGGYGGGVYCAHTSGRIEGCVISDNNSWAEDAGYGGGIYLYEGSPDIVKCRLTGNVARFDGGGIYCYGSKANTRIINCLISNNQSGVGGGVCCDWEGPSLWNCTISFNQGIVGGGVGYDMASPSLENCILWGDTPNEIDGWGGTPVLSYCDIEGGWSGSGSDNIALDPCFVDGSNADPNLRDYRLRRVSPCIDAGNPFCPGCIIYETDLDGQPRVTDGDCNCVSVVDMGAYELGAGDLDCNGSVNMVDFAIFALAWLTEPGDDQWNPCCDMSFPPDGYVDWRDLGFLVGNWLAGL